MIKASITADLKVIEDFKLFKKDIREKVIENGLDKPLVTSLQKLKQDLNSLINTRIKSPTNPNEKDPLNNKKIILPKSDEEILKHLTGVDIPKINKSKDYSTSIKDGVLVVDDHRVRLRLPISPYATFDEVYEQAKKFFNQAVFVIKDGNEIKYLKNPGIDISQFVKVVCSRDAGDTEKSRKKFEAYRDSNIMPRQGNSDIGRYAEWSLKQEGMKQIMHPTSGFVDMSHIVKKIKDGDIDEAIELAKNLPDKNSSLKTIEKVEELKDLKKVNPTTKAYINIVRLIKNMTILKSIKEDVVTYSLASNFSGTTDEIREDELFQEIEKNISLWVIENSNGWFTEIVKVAGKTIQEFYKAG